MVTLRAAVTGDTGSIQRIARTTWHATYDDSLGSETVDEQVDEWYADDIVRESITAEETVYLVATVDDAVVAYAVAGPTDEHDTTATLHAIYVRPRDWGDGIGSQLLSAVTDRLRDREFDRLRIPVLADNDRARSFYDHHGYTAGERRQIELAGENATEVVHDGPL